MAARWHAPASGGSTYCLPPGRLPPHDLPPDIRETLLASETGGFLLWSLGEAHLALPPFPFERLEDQAGWHTGPLISLLDKPRRVLVVLVRLGGFAIGIFEGERLVASKVDAPFVKGRHRAGGSSSGRFVRRHEGQARMLFDKASDTLRSVVEAYGKPPQHLVLGGDRLTLQAFEKRCDYLSRFKSIRLARILTTIPDPRLEVLRDTPRLFYASQVLAFRGLPPGPGGA